MLAPAPLWLQRHPVSFLLGSLVLVVALIVSCGGGMSMKLGPSMGTVTVSISDPPSCMAPKGPFIHVFITVSSVKVNASSSAGDTSDGWQELAPQLASAPVQVDLFSQPNTTCILAQLGSASLPTGSIQQIRLVLLSNNPAASAAVPSPNACAGHGFNCVVANDGMHELLLSSEAQTGLKIPSAQIVGGPIQVTASQSVDLNIDFNACASIVMEGNGAFRLKPVLTAGVVSPNNSGVQGQVLDSVTKMPVTGNVMVAIEQPDTAGIDRIVMQTATDAQGNFRFCPLPSGTFDVVVVGLTSSGAPYNATTALNVPNGTNLGSIPLVAESGATAPATLQGFVTAKTASAGATIDVSLAALQSVTLSGGGARQLTIPLQNTSSVNSTGLISVMDSKNCPTGSPMGANCAQYTLVVPASNPSVGVFTSAGITFAAPASGDVLFTVDAQAAAPMSGGTPDCTPPEIMTSNDSSTPPQPLKVTAGMTSNVAEIDFSGCS